MRAGSSAATSSLAPAARAASVATSGSGLNLFAAITARSTARAASRSPRTHLVPERIPQRLEVEQRAEGVEGDRVRLHASELPGVVLP